MKKALIVVIILIIAALILYSLRGKTGTGELQTPQVNVGGTFRPDPSNATFTIDDEEVTLSAGRNAGSAVPGTLFTDETLLLDQLAYGDINADGKEDTVLFLARSGGGSGTFIYLATFVSGPVTYRGSKATFLGDRIAPQSLSISNGIVTVKYLDRGSEEALAAEPTMPVSKQFVYKSGELQER